MLLRKCSNQESCKRPLRSNPFHPGMSLLFLLLLLSCSSPEKSTTGADLEYLLEGSWQELNPAGTTCLPDYSAASKLTIRKSISFYSDGSFLERTLRYRDDRCLRPDKIYQVQGLYHVIQKQKTAYLVRQINERQQILLNDQPVPRKFTKTDDCWDSEVIAGDFFKSRPYGCFELPDSRKSTITAQAAIESDALKIEKRQQGWRSIFKKENKL